MSGEQFEQKVMMVTGGCGTVGYELTRQLVNNFNAKEIIVIDNNESELFFVENYFSKDKNAKFYLADIRDQAKLFELMENVDIIFHAAAFKHVHLCERSPFEAVLTNIMGVQNIISAARSRSVEKVIFTSTDKAVNPTSVMGTSKLMGERLITAASSNSHTGKTIFASTRFGNVLGSRGSVIPLLKEQIKRGGPVTLTDPNMTRFIMSIQEAVALILESSELAKGGEVFITKMPIVKIKDLVEVMIEVMAPKYGHDPKDVHILITGPRPGEKMFEELMNSEETRRTLELEKYFVVLPALKPNYQDIQYEYENVRQTKIKIPYNSDSGKAVSRGELKKMLFKSELFDL